MEIQRESMEYDVVIVGAGPAGLATSIKLKQINPDLESYAFLNRADSRGYDNNEAQELLKENDHLKILEVVICNRKAFSNASSEGKAVNEMKHSDAKAIYEIHHLYQCIFGIE